MPQGGRPPHLVQPDLLLLDLSMPGMDGRDLALRIRQSPYARVPIMFLTGNLVESANRHVPSLEDCPVLGKPVNLSVLITKMGQMLGLEWIFPAPEADSTPPAPPDTPATVPEAERVALLALLDGGNLRNLRAHLTTLRAQHPALGDAIEPLLALAASYQLEALRHHLERPTP